MDQSSQLTEFLRRHALEIFHAAYPSTTNGRLPWNAIDQILGNVPPAGFDDFASALVEMAESDSLRLADLVSTPEGQALVQIAVAGVPPLWRLDLNFLSAGLQRAAEMQLIEGERAAGRQALLILLIGLVVAGSIAYVSSPRPRGRAIRR